jgi:hypothetical protein
MAQKGRGIFMVYVDIDAQHVQEFNEWYNNEHLPELLSVPGVDRAGMRHRVRGAVGSDRAVASAGDGTSQADGDLAQAGPGEAGSVHQAL